MKTQLTTLSMRLDALIASAEDKADSDNEKTAERYETIIECLQAAHESIEEAIAAFDD
jgi:hypothetical protein